MRKGKKGIIFVFMFLLALNSGWAETMRLTLEEAIGLGLQNSSTLKSKKLAVFSAQAGVRSAKSSYYPGVSVSTSYTHILIIPARYRVSSDPISLSADVSQTIYTFGKIKNVVRKSEENVKAAEMDFEEEMRNLIVDIKRGFYGYILAGEVLRVQEETLTYKEEALEVARKRYDAGLSPDYEVLSAESDVENFKPYIISARNQVEFALLAVKNLMGIEEEGADFDIELIGTLEPEYYSFQKETLMKQALTYKYDVSRYKLNITLMEIQKIITDSQNKPTVTGFANYTLDSGYDKSIGDPKYLGKDSWEGVLSLGISVQMPLSALFPWSRENADSKKGALDVEQLKAGLNAIESGIRLNVENILLRLEEEKAKIASGSKGVELAQRLYKSSKDRYASGLISSMEFKDSQIALNNAQLGYLTSIYNYQMALFDLMEAAGVDHF